MAIKATDGRHPMAPAGALHARGIHALYSRSMDSHEAFLVRGQLVSWCFKCSQPQKIISGLKETFIKGHTVERTNKAEIRPEEQSEKEESCRENSWNEIQLKGP